MEAWLCKCVWAVVGGVGVSGCVVAADDESTHLPVLLLMTSD